MDSSHISQKLWLKSRDGIVTSVDRAALQSSRLIKDCLDDCGTDHLSAESPLLLHNVDASVLDRIIQHYEQVANRTKRWELNIDELAEMMLAFNYLDMQSALEDCCQSAANIIRPRLSLQDWGNIDYPVISRHLQDAGICISQAFPQELLDMICNATIQQEISSLKMRFLRRVCGGLRVDRLRELENIAGAYYMFHKREQGSESAICLFEDHAASANFQATPWSKIYGMTRFGAQLRNPSASTIELPSPYDPNLTTFSVEHDQLNITLNDKASMLRFGILPDLDPKATTSLRWILETHAKPQCIIKWCAGKVDLSHLPALPEIITELTMCGMDVVFANRVPTKGSTRGHHWMHALANGMCYVQRLMLDNCGCEPSDLQQLTSWLPSMTVSLRDGRGL